MLRVNAAVVFYMICCSVYAGVEDWEYLVEKTSEMKGLVLSLIVVDQSLESISSLRALYADKLCNPTTYSFVHTRVYGEVVPTDDQISDEVALYCLKRGYFGGLYKIRLNETGEIIGYIFIDEPRDDSYIHFYRHILPHFRGRGYGTIVLELLKKNLDSVSKYLVEMPEQLKDERFKSAIELVKKSIILHEKNQEIRKQLMEKMPTKRNQVEIKKYVKFLYDICSNQIIRHFIIGTLSVRQIWLFEPQRKPQGLLSNPEPFDNPASRRSLEKAGFQIKDRNIIFPFPEVPSYIK